MSRRNKMGPARWRVGPRRTAIVGLAAMALAACSGATDPAGDEEDAKSDGPMDVTAVMDSGATTMNPLYDTAAGPSIFSAVFDSLVDQAEPGSDGPPPRLAESWESTDATTWVFHLVAGATFHNGEPLTADDVVFTFETILGDDENPFQSRFQDIQSMTVIDDTTVQIVLSRPNSAFPAQLATVAIVPDEYYAEVGKDGFDEAPIGSGPYMFVEETPDKVRLEANADYWAGKPPIDTLTFQVIESTTSAIAALESGDVDVVGNIPPGDAERLDAVDEISVHSVVGRQAVFLGYNVSVAPLDDPKVRAAIDTAVDRQAIVDGLFSSEADTLGQPTPSSWFGHDDSIEPTPYDPEAARDLLASSGYAGEEIVMYYPTSRLTSADQVAEAIVGYLKDVGLNARAEGVEWATHLDNWVGGAIEGMYLFPYINGADPDVIIGSIYAEGSPRIYFDDQEIFDLVVAQRGVVDGEARAQALSDLWKASNDRDYYSWLFAPRALFGIRDGVPINASSTGRVWISAHPADS